MAKFIDSADIVAWVQLQLAHFQTSDLPEIIVEMATTKVLSELSKRRVHDLPTVDDEFHFLKFATMSFALELLCKSRKITQTSGDILRDSFGEITHDYQRSNPLFFFAQGTSESFMALLPYETFRMYGYAFCDAWVKREYYDRKGYYLPKGEIAFDKTSRGFGWNLDTDVIEDADDIASDEINWAE